ncbi:MAG: HEAT repeat domain-containing protein, partial [Chloroflexota bacterium]
VEPLIAALGDADAEVRRYAAWALGEIGDVRAVEPLIAALGDADAEVRRYAAWALGRIGDVRALLELERVAREDNGVTVFGRVADAAQEAVKRIQGMKNA